MKSSHATAAAQIRAELKSVFPGIKFYVKSASFSGGDSVRIEWLNGPTSKQVNAIVDKYQYGSFNAMEDIYEYDNKNTEVEQVKYVQVQREISQDIKDGIRAEYNFADSVAEYFITETVWREACQRAYDALGNQVVEVAEEVAPGPVGIQAEPSTKTIYVTVEEFLQNGGILVEGRVIYNEKHGNIGEFDGFHIVKKGMSNVMCFVQDKRRTLYNDLIFVQIEVKPIYK
jgi:hypothetical protein